MRVKPKAVARATGVPEKLVRVLGALLLSMKPGDEINLGEILMTRVSQDTFRIHKKRRYATEELFDEFFKD